ncbi:MAG: hypothetical protein ABSC20_05205 [Candidatus Bathyarchaeia archaeon]|jgi:bifunctional DNA-binding transcriptional regulator/antitoxin component of YhaV-PrlF toxin-antitoxin module
MRKNRVIVVKKGHVTIPLWIRKKYKIEDGKAFVIIEKKQGLLLKPLNSFWDWIGTGPDNITVEEVKAELDKLRHQDEDE